MRKRILVPATIAVFTLGLTACGGGGAPAETEPTGAAPAAEAPARSPASATKDDSLQSSGESQAEWMEETGGTPSAPAPYTVQFEETTYEVDYAKKGPYVAGDSFVIEDYGVPVIATVEVEAPADIEALREKVGMPPVSYVRVDIDNREGAEDAFVWSFSVYDKEGAAYEYTEASTYHLADWGPNMMNEGDEYWYELPDGTEISEDKYRDLQDEQRALMEKYDGDISLRPGEKGSAILIGPEAPAEWLGYDATAGAYGYLVTAPATKIS